MTAADKPPVEPHGTILGGWFSILLSLFLLAVAALGVVPKVADNSWQTTSARVLSTSMYQRTGRAHDWCAKVKFEYTVDGKTYRNANFSSAIVSSAACRMQKAETEYFLSRLPPATVIRIFYDPQSPSRSAIVREDLGWFDYLFCIGFLFLLGCGIYYIRLGRAILRRAARVSRSL